MSKFVIARVDDRFIHGQITVKWCRCHNINFLLVVNDELATNKVRQGLMDMGVPKSVTSRYVRLSHANEALASLPEDKRIMVIVASIHDLEILLKQGITFSTIILGNIGMAPGRKHFSASVSLTNSEVELLKSLTEQGHIIELRRQPDDTANSILNLLNEEH
ncbi:PTS system mannose/fructose/N-acetylgalactosamine-transporter subunit IIB [Vaginisenegalia massiliensis]|uniref:PTS system mannose/fructose/N-acetylgalactosamine-transporter subunit IIB n=1 Tax=Vaginisenegalia massiliensis TaxID=2058294 RepID=UPI000F52193F|nr:PTS sugar transporter subunit IIB [Vaginisenegalia massiliensis]